LHSGLIVLDALAEAKGLLQLSDFGRTEPMHSEFKIRESAIEAGSF
jgi:hypothetical protein